MAKSVLAPCGSAPRRVWSRARCACPRFCMRHFTAGSFSTSSTSKRDQSRSPASNEIKNRLCFSGNLPTVVPTRVLLAWTNHPWSRAHLSCLEFGNERIVYRASRRPGAAGRGRACHSWHCFTEAGCRAAPLNRIRTNGCAYSCG